MSYKEAFPDTIIRHRGLCRFNGLVTAINQWYVDDDYVTQMIGYEAKVPSPMGAEQDVKIQGTKDITGYVRFHLRVWLKVSNLRDVELIQDGKKLTLQEGQIRIVITPELELDWQNRFKGKGQWGNFLVWLDEFYRKHIIKYKIGDYWEDMLLIKSGQLAKVIKEHLGQEVM